MRRDSRTYLIYDFPVEAPWISCQNCGHQLVFLLSDGIACAECRRRLGITDFVLPLPLAEDFLAKFPHSVMSHESEEEGPLEV